uniref:DUF5641 domain-containing protein n=1 Tax=Anoplophora glabripennis TaxID=217634 RepID=V5GSG3_ANOGL
MKFVGIFPSRAPHFGGLWEGAVKAAKYHLQRIVGNAHLTFEELSTVFIQIEAILNSRPLTPMSDDPNDLSSLTPGHFLIGDALMATPQLEVTTVPVNRLSHFLQLQQIVQHFWKRWVNEYITSLQERTKWRFRDHSNVKIGSLVMLKADNSPPLLWPLGRITELHPGKDGVVRVVSVKTLDGVVKRAVTKVCVLPIETI